MTPQVIQFQCTACQSYLTVPAHLAGVSGPCPKCGQTITSPAAAPVAAVPAIPAPQQQPPPAPAWPAAPPASADIPSPAPPAAPQSPHAPPAWNPPQTGNAAPTFPQTPAAEASLPPLQTAPPPQQTAPQSLLAGFHSPAPASGSAFPQPAAEPHAPAQSPPSAPVLPVLEGGQSHAADSSPSLLSSVLNPAVDKPATAAPPDTAAPPPASWLRAEPAPPPPQPQEAPRQPLPPFPNKPGRGSHFLQRGIALILLLSCLAILGYVGKDRLTALYHRYFAQAGPLDPPSPQVEPPAPETPPVKADPPPPTSSEPPKPEPKPEQEPKSQPEPAPAPADPAPQPPAPVIPAIPPAPETPDGTEPPMEIKRATPALPDDLSPLPLPPPVSPKSLIEVPAAGPGKPASEPSAALTVPDEAKPAADALLEFLAADTLEGKSKFILGIGDPQINALVQRYYGQTPPTPIPVTSIGLIRHDPNPEVGGGMQSVFMVASPEWTYPIPVMLQETKQGINLDWIAFIEFKDNMLFKFVQGYREGPGRFHVSIKRSHYFQRDVPDLENKDCFIIQPPQEDIEVSVFVPKDTPLAEKLRRDLSWSTQYAYVLAEIQWRDDGAHQWVELTAVPQFNWYITTEPASPDTGSEPAKK